MFVPFEKNYLSLPDRGGERVFDSILEESALISNAIRVVLPTFFSVSGYSRRLFGPVRGSASFAAQELPLFSYTQQGGVSARPNAVVCDPDTMSELAILACLEVIHCPPKCL